MRLAVRIDTNQGVPSAAATRVMIGRLIAIRMKNTNTAVIGLDAIAQFWEDEREGPEEVFTGTVAITMPPVDS